MLTVSSPCLLLNHIAQRYTRTSRIIMEYVDNSLDDCEILYDEATQTYKRPITVDVRINRSQVGGGEESDKKEDKKEDPAIQAAAAAVPPVAEGAADEKSPEGDAVLAAPSLKKKKKKAKAIKWDTWVQVTDNCRGMSKETLSRLVQNVGESNKRGSKFTNGQFGFGVHAFRACASRVKFKTKTGDKTLTLTIDRKSEYFPLSKNVKNESEEGIQTESGTEVKVSNFDDTWSDQLDPSEIIKEIQYHFSGLLERKDLQVRVHDVVQGKTVLCQPFIFATTNIARRIEKEFQFEEGTIRCRIYISKNSIAGRNCMFVSKGRRINEICDVKSFMKMSRCRWAVWGHPNLLGYIDVSGVLDPVITRDEFRLNDTRKQVYKTIIEEVEPQLYKKLHEVNENRRVMALAKLEDVVARCMNVAVKRDTRRNQDGISYLQQMMMAKKPIRRRKIDEDFDVEEDEQKPSIGSKKRKRLDDGENPDEEGVKKKRRPNSGLGFNIAFVKDLNDEETNEPLRARLVGGDVNINMKHPDFLTRIKVSKTESQPIVTERLCGYLANVIGAAYKSHTLLRGGGIEKYKEDHSLLLDEILDVTLSLENQLRSKLKLMQKEMDVGSSQMQRGPPPVTQPVQ